MHNPTAPVRALTEPEVAERLSISLRTLQRWRKTNSAPIRPLRGLGDTLIRYSEADLARYLKGRSR